MVNIYFFNKKNVRCILIVVSDVGYKVDRVLSKTRQSDLSSEVTQDFFWVVRSLNLFSNNKIFSPIQKFFLILKKLFGKELPNKTAGDPKPLGMYPTLLNLM